MIKFVGLRAKTFSYLTDDGSDDKKSKRHKKVCHKFKHYKKSLEATQLENNINHLEKNKIEKDSFFCYKN